MSRKECRWFFPKILDVLRNGVAKNIAKIGTNFESRTKNFLISIKIQRIE